MVGVGRDLCGSSSPTPCQSRVTQSRLHRTLSRRGLNISREGDSTTSLGSLGQGSVTLRGKKFFLMCPCSSAPLGKDAHPCKARAVARRAASQAACAGGRVGCQLATEKLVHPETSTRTAWQCPHHLLTCRATSAVQIRCACVFTQSVTPGLMELSFVKFCTGVREMIRDRACTSKLSSAVGGGSHPQLRSWVQQSLDSDCTW